MLLNSIKPVISNVHLQFTLTGHSGYVLSAKFLTDASKVVSGGKDRVIKLWDLRSISCELAVFFFFYKFCLYLNTFWQSLKLQNSPGIIVCIKSSLQESDCSGIKSYFVGWTCTDLVVLDGSVVVSGHFDNNIRLWDIRTDSNTHKGMISLSDKITSLDLSMGCCCICCICSLT